MNKSIEVFAPATISNVGCGFDTIGFAINEPGDIVSLKLRNDKKVIIRKITGDGKVLPYDPKKNTATVGILELLKNYKDKSIGVDVTIKKKMPIGSGLGSSAASSVAAVYGLNKLLGEPFTEMQTLDFAIKGESIASGAIHADNVAPCLFGGFILIRDYNPIDLIKLPVPKNLYCAVVFPHIVIETKKARKLIKKQIPVPKARKHFGNVGALVNALYKNDIDLLGRTIHDEISEPARATLIPGFYDIKQTAIENGAYGCSISGSGPSIFAFAKSKAKAEQIGKAMQIVVKANGMKSNLFVSKINSVGPKVIK
ncbi:MAG: homoserine kinase [Ignavibacteriae bacterium]|nr:homoserine kinase [Ignavibacteriota bacterium]MCB9210377.1 homoserine kinase [Ignavibacteriales bacterium]MCB9219182.1 homoserine kinase [Ignavibacteriales bacterium]MCB9259764.1 homoserine kinase [Ignavibacteriales bacterium]